MRPKPTVGQKLFALNIGEAARSRPKVLTPVTVTKVGRLYFTCETAAPYKFAKEYLIETWRERTQYTPDSRLYLTEAEFQDEQESQQICQRLGKAFEYGHNIHKIDLATLRRIAALVP